ncbi:restriction endonuclease [Leptospira santarosai]|uniref:restriction endonuclease n=1 Tax=Leptospira santarosai TaxID=28183 RepID=UPI0007739FB0|nr:restriction endonuclease [Leptospira santarosai]MDI7191458.1 restriction endonuclease [Leptospira santarosai]MDI7212143.1 restriction endonuclease [Leptospira santarosai]MDI7215733.1 restriction endonuclease [Leptospira santarosai]MDI7223030.1 restriction endonuclease [Leptospira santarosai]MDI7226852.1 restriction endonuclease [Leptospira santarosai]
MKNMEWRLFEEEIFNHFLGLYPNSKIIRNVKFRGIISNRSRQIDILITEPIASYELRIVVECKYYNKKIDIKAVESFISFLHDVKANKGVMITNHGYTKAAINRAKNDTYTDVQLEIVKYSELKNFKGFGGILHHGPIMSFVTPPPGWLLDGKKRNLKNSLAILHPLGKTLNEALRKPQYILCNVINNFDSNFQLRPNRELENYIKFCQNKLFNRYSRLEEITLSSFVELDGSPSILQKTVLSKWIEYTVYLDYEFFFHIFTLKTTLRTEKEDLRKLEYVVKMLMPGHLIKVG